MLRKRLWDVPVGLWIVAVLVALIMFLLRSFFIDHNELRDAVAIQKGPDRMNLAFWDGTKPLGLVPLWIVTKLLGLFAGGLGLMSIIQLVGAVSVAFTGIILYRWLGRAGTTPALCFALTLLFYFANTTLVAGTMMGQWALNGVFFMGWLTAMAVVLGARNLNSGKSMRLGIGAGLLTALNFMAIAPALIGGFTMLRRGGAAGSYWAGFLGTTALLYLGIYFYLGSEVTMGGVNQPKPGIGEWVLNGFGSQPDMITPFSMSYFRSTGEQLQNFLIPIGRPIRERDFWQYPEVGFNDLLKIGFGITFLVGVGMLIVIWRGEVRQPLPPELRPVTPFLGLSLLGYFLLLLFLHGDVLGAYYWLWSLVLLALGTWIVNFEIDEHNRLSYALTPLVIVLGVFALQKSITLHQEITDPERQLLQLMQPNFKKEDTFIASLKLADWLRYHTPESRVISLEYTSDPQQTIKQEIAKVRQSGGRLIVWDFALQKEAYEEAGYRLDPQWLNRLEPAFNDWEAAKPSSLRDYGGIMLYPTRKMWRGAIRYFEK